MMDILSRLSSDTRLRWFGNRPSVNISNIVIQDIVKSMWDEGKLPYQSSTNPKKWVVGYSCYVSFYGGSASEITVGPKRPYKFRSHYASIEILKSI